MRYLLEADPARRRLLAGMDGAAGPAAPGRGIGVEGGEERRQVGDDVAHRQLDAVHQRAASEAEPFERVELVRAPRALDHQAERARHRPLRRVPRMRRDQQHLALADRHVEDAARLGDLQHHVALELVEELLDGIVVEVDALIGAADHLHHHAGVLEHQLVAHRRLEQRGIVGQPALEIERREWHLDLPGDNEN